MVLKKAFNFYMPLCENSALIRKTVCSFMTSYIHVLIYNKTN
jgi:hypothetical protein